MRALATPPGQAAGHEPAPVVGTHLLTPLGVAVARDDGALVVKPDGTGYVPAAWLDKHPEFRHRPPWNACPVCECLVDPPAPEGEFSDGGEVRCGCGAVLVATAFTDGTWALHRRAAPPGQTKP